MHPYYFENLFFDGRFVVVNIRDANNKDFCETVRLSCPDFLALNRTKKPHSEAKEGANLHPPTAPCCEGEAPHAGGNGTSA
jgi:hypothetical protein